MSFWRFVRNWLALAANRSWETAHIIHQVCFLIASGLACWSVYEGIRHHEEEPKLLVIAPAIGTVIVLLGSFVYYAYRQYRDEYDKRIAAEPRGVELERINLARGKLEALNEQDREVIKQVLLEQHVRGQRIKATGVKIHILAAETGFLELDGEAGEWRIRSEWQKILAPLLFPNPEPILSQRAPMWSIWSKLWRRLIYTVRVLARAISRNRRRPPRRRCRRENGG